MQQSLACRAWAAIALSRLFALAADLEPGKDCHVHDETSMIQVSSVMSTHRGAASLQEDQSEGAPMSRAAPSFAGAAGEQSSSKSRARSSESLTSEDIAFMNGMLSMDSMHYLRLFEKAGGQMKPFGGPPYHWSTKASNKTWTDSQCNNVGNRNGGSVQACQDLCILSVPCNAINFNQQTNDCVLRACPMPYPFPSLFTAGYQGYHLQLHHDRFVQQGLTEYPNSWDFSNTSVAAAPIPNTTDMGARVQQVEEGLTSAEAAIGEMQKSLAHIDDTLDKLADSKNSSNTTNSTNSTTTVGTAAPA